MKMDDLLLASDGRMVTVTFVKKDGSLRTLNGRLGVKKHLKGGVSTLDPSQYITIYDVKAAGYRAVNRDTIKGLRVGGLVITNA